jgi:hypothetical protein
MGKVKYIESPDRMWELFLAYKKKVKENPRFKHELDKFGNIVPIPIEMPLTMEGFECFVMDNTNISYPDLTEYFEGKNPSYSEYFPIAARIRREFRTDQISGGMGNLYNANLTARLNGLTDKSETTIVTEQPLFPD